MPVLTGLSAWAAVALKRSPEQHDGSFGPSTIRVYTRPAHAPELNPVEKVWSHLKRGLANLAAGTVTNLASRAKTRLKKMQYADGLVDGFMATGVSRP